MNKAAEIIVTAVHAASTMTHQPSTAQLASWQNTNQSNQQTTSISVPRRDPVATGKK